MWGMCRLLLPDRIWGGSCAWARPAPSQWGSLLRVAAVIPMYPPASRVGAWLATHEYLAALVARGHRVDVFTRISPMHDIYELDGVVVGNGRGNQQVDIAIACSDLVVSHAGDDLFAPTAAKKWGKPSVRMVHGWNRDLYERIVGADLAVFNSQSLVAAAQGMGWDGNHLVIWPPLRAERYVTTPGDLVTLVNLSEMKGGDLLWRLARNALHVNFLGVIGGYGRQVRDKAPNVEIVPNTTNMRDDVYSRTRILLVPSEQEAWGMTALEAAVSGIPAICHPTPGLLESLGEAATFVDRADAQGWLNAIDVLGEPDRWAEKSTLSRARAAEVAADDGVERFVAAVEELVGVSCAS